jgi:hypothetical protein
MWQANIILCSGNSGRAGDNYALALGMFSCPVGQEAVMHVMVRDKRTGTEQWLPLEQVAELMELDATEIEWALEEFGEYESVDHIALDQDW